MDTIRSMGISDYQCRILAANIRVCSTINLPRQHSGPFLPESNHGSTTNIFSCQSPNMSVSAESSRLDTTNFHQHIWKSTSTFFSFWWMTRYRWIIKSVVHARIQQLRQLIIAIYNDSSFPYFILIYSFIVSSRLKIRILLQLWCQSYSRLYWYIIPITQEERCYLFLIKKSQNLGLSIKETLFCSNLK